ncbi:MAG: hypothetical protein R3C68_08720 [Myxococcota bacterium]
MHQSYVVAVLAVGFIAAGCGGSGSLSPEKAAQLFTNPDGALTSDNATPAVNKAIQSTLVDEQAGNFSPFGTPGGLTSATYAQGFDSACVDVQGQSSVTIDMACIAQELECTGSGSMSFKASNTSSADNFSISFRYNNASLMCQGEPEFQCNGSGSVSQVDGVIVSCSDLTCTVDGVQETLDSCFSVEVGTGNNLVLVTVDDGSVVCVNVRANAGCTQACTEWRDSAGDARIVCDVATTTGTGCSTNGEGIETVSNCVIDRQTTSCADF